MKQYVVVTVGAFALASCADVSNVVPTGPQTYMVAAQGVMGNSSSGKQAVRAQAQAAAYCSAQGKQVETISTNEVPGGFGRVASAAVNFRCISK